MNNLLEMLTKAGYEVSSIGNDVLPCTLRLGNEPIGFLMGDLSVRLLPDRENERARIQPVLSFAAENQGIELIQDEFKLSQYKDTVLAAGFDYDNCRPVYNVYLEDTDKNLILLNSFDEQSEAAKDFVSRSGLVSGDIPSPTREVDRIHQFMDEIRTKGFQIRENREDAHRAFDIADQDGHVVGYIGKDNKVTITSENSRIKRTLTSAYLDTNPNSILLPSFFERLKDRLKEIGLALKVIFTPKGRHYAIHNEQHQEIATVSEKEHTLTYTDTATEEQRAKIDALVEELQHESREKEQSQEKQAEDAMQEAPVLQRPAASADEVQKIAETILSDPEETEVLIQAVLSHPEFIARLNETRNVQAATAERQPHQESPAASKVKQDFDRYYNYLQTVFGFSPEKYDAAKAEMIARFGTTEPKEFQAMLEQGKFDQSDTLQGKLETSQRIAELKNSPSQEHTQERERA